MAVKIEKLDARHSLNNLYTHRARVNGLDNVPNFVEMRNWLWETFGPGLERDTVWIMCRQGKVEPKWAWYVDGESRYFLYLKEEVLTHFTLKWLEAN